jgi:hypothetical protein
VDFGPDSGLVVGVVVVEPRVRDRARLQAAADVLVVDAEDDPVDRGHDLIS